MVHATCNLLPASVRGVHLGVHHQTNDTSVKSIWATLQEKPMIFSLVQGILSGFALVFYAIAFGRGGSSAGTGYGAFTSIFGIAAAGLSLAARWSAYLTLFHLLLANVVATVVLATGGVAAAVKGFSCVGLGCALADVMAILLFLACLASAGAAFLARREYNGKDVADAPAPAPVTNV